MLNEGTKAPDFQLRDQNGKEHKLSDYQGKKVVLYFYPKDMTPGCTKEACNFRDNFSQFEEEDVVVLGVSNDPVESHKKFSEKHDLPFPLLSDTNKTVSKKYEVYGKKNLFGKLFNGIKRTTYIIDEDGKIEKVYKKVNVKNHSEEILKELR